MSNLIPEKRFDKNGRLVTKHVRASLPSESSSPIPSPKPVSGAVRPDSPLLHANLDTFQKEVTDRFTTDDLAPEAVEMLEKLLLSDFEKSSKSYSVSNSIGTALLQGPREKCVNYFHRVAVFASVITSRKDGASVSPLITGLSKYSESVLWPDVDYLTEASDEMTERVKNLIGFTLRARDRDAVADILVYDSFLDQWGDGDVRDVYVKVKDDDLALYIMDHPEHGDAIIDLIEREGRALPAELIAERLHHEVQPLREGVL